MFYVSELRGAYAKSLPTPPPRYTARSRARKSRYRLRAWRADAANPTTPIQCSNSQAPSRGARNIATEQRETVEATKALRPVWTT